jgi:hypothetical protein
MPLESRVVARRLDKSIIEDQQFASFLTAAQFIGATGALTNYQRVPNDPPDLLVSIDERQPLAVELTTLSTSDVSRQRLHEIRTIGQALQDWLNGNPADHPHLRGRIIGLLEMSSDQSRPAKRRGAQFDGLISDLASALSADFGVIQGFPPNPDGSLPEVIPAEVAQQGRKTVHEYSLEVHPGDPPDAPPKVIANVQLEIYEDDLRERLLSKIAEKDIEQNQILLISTGLVDTLGYVMTGDQFVFHCVHELLQAGLRFNPVHLCQVILHQWGTPNATLLFERSGSPALVDSSARSTTP